MPLFRSGFRGQGVFGPQDFLEDLEVVLEVLGLVLEVLEVLIKSL